jgi:hypothetical protein
MAQNLRFALNRPTIGWSAYISATPIIKQWVQVSRENTFYGVVDEVSAQ